MENKEDFEKDLKTSEKYILHTLKIGKNLSSNPKTVGQVKIMKKQV
jgi:hypothetical protein